MFIEVVHIPKHHICRLEKNIVKRIQANPLKLLFIPILAYVVILLSSFKLTEKCVNEGIPSDTFNLINYSELK